MFDRIRNIEILHFLENLVNAENLEFLCLAWLTLWKGVEILAILQQF